MIVGTENNEFRKSIVQDYADVVILSEYIYTNVEVSASAESDKMEISLTEERTCDIPIRVILKERRSIFEIHIKNVSPSAGYSGSLNLNVLIPATWHFTEMRIKTEGKVSVSKGVKGDKLSVITQEKASIEAEFASETIWCGSAKIECVQKK